MNDTAKTKLINSRDPAKSAQVPQQSQADVSALRAQQSQTGLSDQRPVPGRKPLFRS